MNKTSTHPALKTPPLAKVILRLCEIEPDKSPLLSCFVDASHPRSLALSTIEDEARIVMARLTGQRRADFVDAFTEIMDYLRNSLDPSTRGVAIYARWGDSPTFIPLQFKVPIETALIVDDIPHIYPLIELKDTYHRFVTVISTKEEARILETMIGEVTEEILAKRPEVRRRVGREWTREHFHRHRAEKKRQFVREKIEIIDQLMGKRGNNHLILAGSEEMVNHLARELPERLRSKVLSTLAVDTTQGVDPILLESVRIFATAEDIESRTRVRELESALLTGGLGVAGPGASEEALSSGYAEVLIIDQDYADEETRERLVRLATASGAEIETVNRSKRLSRLSGVGCLLRYRPDNLPHLGKEIAA